MIKFEIGHFSSCCLLLEAASYFIFGKMEISAVE
jgi:hypothetical protein